MQSTFSAQFDFLSSRIRCRTVVEAGDRGYVDMNDNGDMSQLRYCFKGDCCISSLALMPDK